MQLGAFSISLSVKDLKASETFYRKLGFAPFGGDSEQNWLILKNGDTVIGLFQDMFPDNILTFNPGWNEAAENVDDFTDIRDLQKALKAKGVEFTTEADPDGSGPASFTIIDPDGNPILVDQHRA
ncbi:hypothetical protein GCM10009096_33990 [Parasphingorhabdus litoris]|uniref:VOC domain-containing protein n=1 Tax=Parasphingorhabdus litoris TaxID=394733 RepID=A0ABN1B1T8_9SPHN|nr:VOC family protein [Parasphingorhabdus litoris]